MPKAYTTVDDSLAVHLQDTLEQWDKYRKPWETRWAKSYNRVNNVYQKEFAGTEGAGGRSKHFYGMTRQKCRVALSLLYETVFQRGRVPFDMGNTPISDSEDTVSSKDVGESPEDRAKAMLKLLDDQFIECKLDTKLRQVLKSGIEMGTGVLRGPFVVERTRNQWVPRLPKGADQAMAQLVAQFQAQIQQTQGDEEAAAQIQAQMEQALQQFVQENRFYDLKRTVELYPDFEVVDIWDVWLDPNSDDQRNSVGNFERRLLSQQEFAALAKAKDGDGKPLYDKEAIKDLLTIGSSKNRDANKHAELEVSMSRGPHRDRLTYENIKDQITTITYTGVLPAHILEQYSRENKGNELKKEDQNIDDFGAIECVVEFCRGRVIRFETNKYPRAKRLYYVFRWAKEAGAPYGWGLADELEHPQSCTNGFLRLFLDTKRLASTVGRVIREGKIISADSSLKPGFTIVVDENTKPTDAVSFVTIPDVSGNCLDALKFCEDWASVASGLPAYLEGDNIGPKANTAFEAGQLKESALKQLGIPIQSMDDDVIVPLVESVYDWNMQYAASEKVKGDFTIAATGFATFKSKTLVGIELRNLLNLYMQAPQLFPAIDADAILRELERLGELPEGRFVLPQDKADAKAQQNQQAQQAAMAAQAQAAAQQMQMQVQAQTQGRIAEIQAQAQAQGQVDIAKIQESGQVQTQGRIAEIQAQAQAQAQLAGAKDGMTASEADKKRKHDMVMNLINKADAGQQKQADLQRQADLQHQKAALDERKQVQQAHFDYQAQQAADQARIQQAIHDRAQAMPANKAKAGE